MSDEGKHTMTKQIKSLLDKGYFTATRSLHPMRAKKEAVRLRSEGYRAQVVSMTGYGTFVMMAARRTR